MSFSLQLIILPTVLSAVLAGGSLLASAAAPDTGASADEVMTHVKAEATAGHKNILLTFGASWCVNCRLFDKFFNDPAIHPIMDKAFVFADLNTGEQPNDKRHANISVGQKLQTALGGKTSGYPYFVMLDSGGSLIASSIRPAGRGHGGNIGYPVAPYEIDWFMEMLQKAAPSMPARDAATVRNWLTVHAHRH